jgi:hypothetical protein
LGDGLGLGGLEGLPKPDPILRHAASTPLRTVTPGSLVAGPLLQRHYPGKGDPRESAGEGPQGGSESVTRVAGDVLEGVVPGDADHDVRVHRLDRCLSASAVAHGDVAR